ncbi:protein disulfide isomerase [Mycena floridula]|nr:protein disulfide isomerase [Mycena floridula]
MLGLRQLLWDLPISLLLTSLVLAIPVQTSLTPLTPANFQSTISKGYWLIEHFSPHCVHCRKFAPTWEALVKENEAGAHPGVGLQQVDCAMHGDLCNANGVKGYPQLNLYLDGKFVEKYNGDRSQPELNTYLKRYATPTATTTTETTTTTTEVAARSTVTPNPDGTVLVLTGETFQSKIDEGPAFVKFYAPWCGHCKKLAPIWKNLAKHLQNKLTIAEVDCEEHKALCVAEGVPGYPTLFYYTAGSKTEYNGGRKLDQLKAFAEKASASTTLAIQADDLEKHVKTDDVVYVLVHSDDSVIQSLAPQFSALLGTPMVYTISKPPESLYTQFGIPSTAPFSLVALKDHDSKTVTGSYSPSQAVVNNAVKAEVAQWLATNRLPSITELTQDSFQTVMNAPHKPLVVLAAVTKDSKASVQDWFTDVSKKWRVHTKGTAKSAGREVIFAWMDVERWQDWMKSMYGMSVKSGSDLADVEVVIADHQSLVYYKTESGGGPIKITLSASIFSAIEAAASGKSTAHHSENMVERLARYANRKMTSLESEILTHPLRTVFFGFLFMGLVIMVLRRFVTEDVRSDRDYMRGKGRRD